MIVNNANLWYSSSSPALQDLFPFLTDIERDWLLDQRSLTKRLLAKTEGLAEHKLCFAGWSAPILEEACLFGGEKPQRVWLREIEWRFQESTWVVAKVVIPEQSCTDQLLGLGSRPLGELLFSDPNGKRVSLEITALAVEHPYTDLLVQRGLSNEPPLWARRSLFRYCHQPLLVVEIFLPAIFAGDLIHV